VVWGAIALFTGIILGYAMVITAALNAAIAYPVATLICIYLCYASFTVQHDASHGRIIKMGSPYKFIEDMIGWVASVPLMVAKSEGCSGLINPDIYCNIRN